MTFADFCAVIVVSAALSFFKPNTRGWLMLGALIGMMVFS